METTPDIQLRDDSEKIIGTSDYDGTPLLLKDVVKGNFIKKRYITCPHMENKCSWRMANEHRKGYEYLNNSCYLSGSFELKCP